MSWFLSNYRYMVAHVTTALAMSCFRKLLCIYFSLCTVLNTYLHSKIITTASQANKTILWKKSPKFNPTWLALLVLFCHINRPFWTSIGLTNATLGNIDAENRPSETPWKITKSEMDTSCMYCSFNLNFIYVDLISSTSFVLVSFRPSSGVALLMKKCEDMWAPKVPSILTSQC